MSGGALAYLVFGLVLVALFAAVVAHYYARGRRAKIEEAKYRMLEDDDEAR